MAGDPAAHFEYVAVPDAAADAPQARRRRSVASRAVSTTSVAAAVVLLAIVGCLPSPCMADTWDVQVKLYRDPNCFERADDLTLMDEGCYANIYSNLSKAFKLKIVRFEEPQQVDLTEYTDNCYTVYLPKKPLRVNKCERFAGGYYGMLSTRFRAVTCEGEMCSLLAVAHQRFYEAEGCVGTPYYTYRYPAQMECLRWFNGTRTFTYSADDKGANLTQTDYPLNDRCDGGLAKTYEITGGECYPLRLDRPPRSFKWEVDDSAKRAAILAASGGRRGVGRGGAELLLLLAIAAVAGVMASA
eukprot:TRINITY_DN8571_c0_g1_i1.p1 TRINITY_DN8571_c0_g1~~TRINITY_DN8571_c0_g1_i1.p1  ORF type:complete len:300 (+),score=64.12 TRINITY_DN8571_c0_g1_i1:114-1013(+)